MNFGPELPPPPPRPELTDARLVVVVETTDKILLRESSNEKSIIKTFVWRIDKMIFERVCVVAWT